jgi:hypothetical protein
MSINDLENWNCTCMQEGACPVHDSYKGKLSYTQSFPVQEIPQLPARNMILRENYDPSGDIARCAQPPVPKGSNKRSCVCGHGEQAHHQVDRVRMSCGTGCGCEKFVRRSDVAAPEQPVSAAEGICKNCASAYVTWFTENEIWNTAVPESGMLCPNCFLARAERAGIADSAWKIVPEFSDDALRREIAALKDSLMNLLAVIHRDGGHYTFEYGIKKASEDAEKIVTVLRSRIAELEKEK